MTSSVRWARSALPAITPRWNRSSRCSEERPGPTPLADPRGAADRDHHLDREDLSPSAPAGSPGSIDPHRIRHHHEPGRTRGLTPQLAPKRAAVPDAAGGPWLSLATTEEQR